MTPLLFPSDPSSLPLPLKLLLLHRTQYSYIKPNSPTPSISVPTPKPAHKLPCTNTHSTIPIPSPTSTSISAPTPTSTPTPYLTPSRSLVISQHSKVHEEVVPISSLHSSSAAGVRRWTPMTERSASSCQSSSRRGGFPALLSSGRHLTPLAPAHT